MKNFTCIETEELVSINGGEKEWLLVVAGLCASKLMIGSALFFWGVYNGIN